MLLSLDFDGTLADSRTAVETSLFWVASKDSEDSVRRLQTNLGSIAGKVLEHQLRSFLITLDLDQAREIYMSYYQAEGIQKTILNPGAEKLLSYCRSNNVQVVVISAKTEENLQLSMSHLGVDDIPSFGGCDQNQKSHLMRTLQVDLYVGDQESDIIAARNANVKSVYLGSKQSLRLHPDFMIKELTQIIDIMERL